MILRPALPFLLVLTACAGTPNESIAIIESGLVPAFVMRGVEPRKPSLAARMAELGVPGVSIAVITDGEIAWAKGYGLADVASQTPVTPLTRFQAASISKPVAALVALRLVEQGALDLDGDVNETLTSWRVPDNEFTTVQKVTLRRLLNHTAGTTVWGFPGYGPSDTVPNIVGVLDGLGNTEPVRVFKEPGISWRYSGGGYTVMQLLVEDVTGRPFAKVLETEVLVPIGMTRSTYLQPIPQDLQDDIATGYRDDGSAVDGKWHTYPEQAAAGLWTTPSDLARYLIEIQRSNRGESNRVLSEAMTKQMLTEGENNHGLGPAVYSDVSQFAHNGSNEGFRAAMLGSITGGYGVVVMTNSDAGSRLAREIMLTVAAAYGWPAPTPDEKVPVAVAASVLQDHTGTYAVADSPIRGTVVLVRDSLRLVVRADTIALVPLSETRFFDLDDGREVEFVTEGSDKILMLGSTRARRIAR